MKSRESLCGSRGTAVVCSNGSGGSLQRTRLASVFSLIVEDLQGIALIFEHGSFRILLEFPKLYSGLMQRFTGALTGNLLNRTGISQLESKGINDFAVECQLFAIAQRLRRIFGQVLK